MNCHFHFEYTCHIVPWTHPLYSELNVSVCNYCYTAPPPLKRKALVLHSWGNHKLLNLFLENHIVFITKCGGKL